MTHDDPPPSDRPSAADGILHCLRMLAEEADNFRLFRTQAALRKAIRACKNDQSARLTPPRTRVRPGLVLH